jgi:hypothetical protein
VPSLEDLMLDCGMKLTAARKAGALHAVAVLEPQMDRYLDQWLMFYPVPDRPTHTV